VVTKHDWANGIAHGSTRKSCGNIKAMVGKGQRVENEFKGDEEKIIRQRQVRIQRVAPSGRKRQFKFIGDIMVLG